MVLTVFAEPFWNHKCFKDAHGSGIMIFVAFVVFSRNKVIYLQLFLFSCFISFDENFLLLSLYILSRVHV